MALGLTTSDLGPPDYDLALEQHVRYVKTLESLGIEVTVLSPLPDYPDAHFVEDTAVVTPHIAVITNPGAESRRGERDAIEPVLAEHRSTVRVEPPGTLDGGDVLEVGTEYFIGISSRTNREGAEQLGRIIEGYGNCWCAIDVRDGLHLKSSVSYIGRGTLLATESLADACQFRKFEKIVVEGSESCAASSLLINGRLMIASGFPGTKARLETKGFHPIEIDISEMRKMDGGLTCLSIRL